MQDRNYILVGGAGFIGSHFVDRLLADAHIGRVTIYDNFSSGREWHYEHHKADQRLRVIRADVNDVEKLNAAVEGHDVVIHFASNPDIAKAATEPDIDFREGTVLTNNVVEAMRKSKSCKKILYTSGSGVYGDLGEIEAHENHGPNTPISTYGASKLAGEALIAAYSFMFDLRACVFRFGNVVGPRQTHGVGFDFARQLLKNPDQLKILGDGSQSKSYVHVTDVVNAVLLASEKSRDQFSAYNVATGDYITVREIAALVVDCLGLSKVEFQFGGGNRGWKGDVPVVRLNTDKIRQLGWSNKMNSEQALRQAVLSMVQDMKSGKM